ncbi:MAG: hypothetical protein V1646_04410 [bacterium]
MSILKKLSILSLISCSLIITTNAMQRKKYAPRQCCRVQNIADAGYVAIMDSIHAEEQQAALPCNALNHSLIRGKEIFINDVKFPGALGRSDLHDAIEAEDVEMVEALILSEADVNAIADINLAQLGIEGSHGVSDGPTLRFGNMRLTGNFEMRGNVLISGGNVSMGSGGIMRFENVIILPNRVILKSSQFLVTPLSIATAKSNALIAQMLVNANALVPVSLIDKLTAMQVDLSNAKIIS